MLSQCQSNASCPGRTQVLLAGAELREDNDIAQPPSEDVSLRSCPPKAATAQGTLHLPPYLHRCKVVRKP